MNNRILKIPKFSLILLLFCALPTTVLADDTPDNLIYDASSPLDILRKDNLITGEDFVKANKEIEVQHVNDLCALIGNSSTHKIIWSEIDM
ncbi:MAG: hypothetical protein U5L02_04335, partial [Rheinheimera sp.]|nr:hypothetical protein [Rheinheimera sp.]